MVKLRLDKCKLFQQVKFLRHLVDREGVKTDPEETQASLGLACSIYHPSGQSLPRVDWLLWAIFPGFSKLAWPLNNLLNGSYSHPPNMQVRWSTECQKPFEHLKHALIETPVLASADFSKPFVLYTDANKFDLLCWSRYKIAKNM